jgi:hypothetical protein
MDMTEIHLTLRGKVGDRQAEVRLEPGQLRLQVLTVIAQQPALDATFPLRDLVDLRVRRGTRWSYVVVAIVFAILMGKHAPPSIRELGLTAFLIYVLMLPVCFGLIAWLLPRMTFRMATQDSFAELEISPFGRRRATELIAAVRIVRPDIPT